MTLHNYPFGSREPDILCDPPRLSDLPCNAQGVQEIELDFETNGVLWHKGHRPGGCGVGLPDGSTYYLAWGHKGGGNNISEEGAKAWFRDQIAGKRITNISTGFEVHMAREWGIDLEDLGCTVSDVAHWAALIDDHRRKFSLEALCLDFLPESERKVISVNGFALNPARMMDYPASIVAVRAEADVRQVGLLKKVLWPKLDTMDLQRVRALEDEVIFAACEMEHNAAPIDVEKLELWVKQSEEALDKIRREVSRAVGRPVQEGLFNGGREAGFLNPDSSKDMEALFQKLGLPIARTGASDRAPNGRPSFTKDVLAGIDHPTIKLIVKQSRLLDLRSKYLLPYAEAVKRDNGLLRFRLHQCRGDEYGTARGRFSSSDKNIQQVMKPSKQRALYGDEFIIRELFVPGPDALLVSSDAAAVEYRIFASLAGTPSVLEAYRKNPKLKFHDLTLGMLQKYKPDLDYDRGKTLNFLVIYGGGIAKLALELKHITFAQFSALSKEFKGVPYGIPRSHPLLSKTLEIKYVYDRALPEVGPLSKRVRDGAINLGYVIDALGRRATFPGGFGVHGALNAIIQPTAAEVNKLKVVRLHKARKQLGLVPRMTVHDEWIGDCPSLESLKALDAILNDQSSYAEFRPKLRVPLLWDSKWGMNWANVMHDEDQFKGMGCTPIRTVKNASGSK